MQKLKVKVALQPLGALLIWLCVLAIPLGLWLRSGPLVLLGLMMGAGVVLARWLCGGHLQRVEVERRLPARAFFGAAFEASARVINRHRWLPVRELELRDQLAGSSGNVETIDLVLAGSSREHVYPLRIFHRGRLKVDHFTLRSRWPLGLFESTLVGRFIENDKTGMLLLPKPVLPPSLARAVRESEQQAAMHSMLVADELAEFRQLREFRPGDPVRSIHWSATLRSRGMIVRETDPPVPKPSRFAVVLFHFAPEGDLVQPKQFETIIRVAAGLIITLKQREIPLSFAFYDGQWQRFRVPESRSYTALLDFLAEVQSVPYSAEPKDQNVVKGFLDDCPYQFILSDAGRSVWESSFIAEGKEIISVDSTDFTKRRRKKPMQMVKQRKINTQEGEK